MTCIAVLDVETTGLNPYRHDRIIEIAVVVIRADGTVVRELGTLVNPQRDIGPTRVHGLTTRDILEAPRFSEVAGALIEVLDGCSVLAGHNIRFDRSFLASEFERLGHPLPDSPTLCTMQLAGGGSLTRACMDYAIAFNGEAHAAWHDAYATAQLLAALLKDAPHLLSQVSGSPPIAWPNIPKSPVRLLTRNDARKCQAEPPTYLQKLLSRRLPELPSDDQDSATLAYIALLDRVLEDRHVDDAEGQALFEIATRWSIPGKQIQRIHWNYLLSLGAAALADGVVTDAERRDLNQVALLLGIDSQAIDEILESAYQKLSDDQTRSLLPIVARGLDEFAGKQVCFTGECLCRLKGEAISRGMAAELATSRGMIVTESVTKKLDVLVVADPLTQSGKAKKARQYGIRIMHEPVFWRALGLEVG